MDNRELLILHKALLEKTCYFKSITPAESRKQLRTLEAWHAGGKENVIPTQKKKEASTTKEKEGAASRVCPSAGEAVPPAASLPSGRVALAAHSLNVEAHDPVVPAAWFPSSPPATALAPFDFTRTSANRAAPGPAISDAEMDAIILKGGHRR